MKSSLKVCLFAILLVVFVYIVYPTNLSYANSENGQSTIGGIVVDGLKSEGMKAKIQEAVNQWTSEPITVSGAGAIINLQAAAIQFDIDGTIATYEQMTKRSWLTFWKSKRVVQLPLQIADSELLKVEIEKVKVWETDSTYKKVLAQAANLASHEIEADVKNMNVLDYERIALEIQPIPDNVAGLSNLVTVLNEQAVNPGQVFSLVEALGTEIDRANNETLDFVASMLYSIALKTNSEIYERASQNSVPSYLEPGIEATVTRNGSKDLKFLNMMDYAMQLKFTMEAGNLKAEAYGPANKQNVGIQVTRDYEISPRVIIRYSKDLPAGSEQLIEEGQAGFRVSVIRYSAEEPKGELISKDYYVPTHRVVLKSSKESEAEVSESLNYPLTNKPQLDLNGDGLADYDNGEEQQLRFPQDEKDLPKGSYYDKGGNLVTP
ncbi:VanW family protein [Metasolibacillus meyeri]|uniref:VanW family protein n=1 Tax=Metasolibacillus meyeri TaxID=1071052 RepID=A0AAW9NT29_9BACL|nr:VanW family protein [Metasolibacillus meyeri]MEC1179248.1 VanW family protein [Metasolibacillus meyeri]